MNTARCSQFRNSGEDLQHVWHGNVQHQGLDQRPPLEIDRADDVWVWEVEGRRYLDAMAGLGASTSAMGAPRSWMPFLHR